MTQQDLHRLLKSFKWLDHDMEPPENYKIMVTTVPVDEAEWLEYSPALRENEKGKKANGVYLPGPLGQVSHCEFSKALSLWNMFPHIYLLCGIAKNHRTMGWVALMEEKVSKALHIPHFTLSHLFTISLICSYCLNKSHITSVHTNARYNRLGYAAVTNNPKFQQLITAKVFFLLLLCIHCKLVVAFAICHPHSRRTDDGDTTTWNSTGRWGRWRERWRILHIKFHFTYISLAKEN